MQFRKLAVIGVVLLVALSGCTSLGGFGAGDSPDETQPDGEDPSENTSETDTDENDSPNESQDSEDDSDGDGSTDDSSTDDREDDESTQSRWSPPQQPNMPLERKDDNSTRIKSVEFVDKVEAENGEGYSDFNIEIVANTSMEDVDPPEYGDVVGEPYFFVKINEGEGNRKIVERTGQVEMTENGTFHIEVRPGGLEEFGENERLTVEVFLMDKDKQYDDIYGAVSKNIHFNPDVESDSSEETDGTESDEADDSNETDGTDDTDDTNDTDESNDTTESDETNDTDDTDESNDTNDTDETSD